MENLSKNTKIVLIIGLLGLSYYLWKQQESTEEVKKIKDGANNCCECSKK